MRGVIWLLLLFVVAVVAASTLGRNDGLVSLYWSGWRLDVSLNLFVIVLVGACIVLMLAIRAVQSLLSLPERAQRWRTEQRERAGQEALRESLVEFFGARYSRAHKAAQRAVAIQESSPALLLDRQSRVLGLLLSGASLHRMQDRVQRDQQLARLGGVAALARRNTDDAVQLQAAEWALDDRDAPRALALLAELPAGVARRTQALRLKLQAQRLERQPLEALRTARLLAKHQAFSRGAAHSLLRSLAIEALEAARDAEQLQRVWQQLDSADRDDAYIAARAATRCARYGNSAAARNMLQPFWDRAATLTRDECEQIALALQGCLDGIGLDWLPRLQAAQQAMPGEPAVLAAVGCAWAERRLWGKARAPLEQAAASPGLASAARRRCWRQLATLAREEGDEARAARCDHEAAAID